MHTIVIIYVILMTVTCVLAPLYVWSIVAERRQRWREYDERHRGESDAAR